MVIFFFFNDTATTEIYTLSLHDALPIWHAGARPDPDPGVGAATGDHRDGVPHRCTRERHPEGCDRDRKSTRLNSSHANISYAVFCLKKKQQKHFILILFLNVS